MDFFLFGVFVVACLIYGLEQVLLVCILFIGLGALSSSDPLIWGLLIFLIGIFYFIHR